MKQKQDALSEFERKLDHMYQEYNTTREQLRRYNNEGPLLKRVFELEERIREQEDEKKKSDEDWRLK